MPEAETPPPVEAQASPPPKPSGQGRPGSGASAPRSSSGGSSSKTLSRATDTNAARNITLAMFFAVGFALLGHELNVKSPGYKPPASTNPITTGGRIILGGFVGGGILIAISHAGDAAAEFATGLAVITAASSVLVYGLPVWNLVGGLYGTAKPTSGGGNTTTPTGSTGTTPAANPTSTTNPTL